MMIDPKILSIDSLPSVPIESRSLLPARPSVYFVIDGQNNILYIGKALNTKYRWSKHNKLEELISIGCVTILYLCLPENELCFAEARLIEYFNPPLNIVIKDSSKITIDPIAIPEIAALDEKDRTTYYRYTVFAIEYRNNNFATTSKVLTRAEQQAIAIYALLSDGEWHTAADVAVRIGIKSKRHIQNIMQALRVPFEISSGQQGYTIPSTQKTFFNL